MVLGQLTLPEFYQIPAAIYGTERMHLPAAGFVTIQMERSLKFGPGNTYPDDCVSWINICPKGGLFVQVRRPC